MKPLERILVVCDHQMKSSPALRRGVELAHRSGAQIHFCIFDFDAGIELTARRVDADVARRAREQFLDERTRWLTEQATAVATQGVRAECDAIWAPRLDEAIVAKALEVKPDLVIKDVELQSGFKRFMFLPRDWKLVRFCPAPLMLVAPGSDQLPRHVLAGVDANEEMAEPSALNPMVVNAALRIALYCDAQVDVASVAPIIPTTGSAYRNLAPAAADYARDFTRAFEALMDRLQVPAGHRHTMRGDAATMLNDFATVTRTDLIVIGTHFRSGWERLFLGSTAETLLNHAQCDVLLIKPAGVLGEITKHLRLPTGDEVPARRSRKSKATA
ncbi:MAG TPA: universal stress protein [Nevskiaceae bacterium]|nr:universal stress protein [Nevskiaceae bacterium]